jgi:hypothetical protein
MEQFTAGWMDDKGKTKENTRLVNGNMKKGMGKSFDQVVWAHPSADPLAEIERAGSQFGRACLRRVIVHVKRSVWQLPHRKQATRNEHGLTISWVEAVAAGSDGERMGEDGEKTGLAGEKIGTVIEAFGAFCESPARSVILIVTVEDPVCKGTTYRIAKGTRGCALSFTLEFVSRNHLGGGVSAGGCWTLEG